MRGLYTCSLALLPRVVGLSLVIVATGCAFESSHSDLRSYIDDVKSKPVGAIEPLPPLRTYDPYVYNVTAKRSPFDPPVEVKQLSRVGDPKIAPDRNREKEYLESFRIDTLSMVGTMQNRGVLWVLVKDGDDRINRVTVGNYMGRDHGKIVSVMPTQIDLMEIVSDGLGGWLQRPRTLKLSEKE